MKLQQIPTHQLTQMNLKSSPMQAKRKQQQNSQSQDSRLQVPPVISDDKQEYLIKQIIYTLFGFPEAVEPFYFNIIFAFLSSSIIIIPPIVIGTLPQLQAQAFLLIAILIPTFLPPIIIYVADVLKYGCLQLIHKNPQKYIILMAYGLLWSSHFYMLARYVNVPLLVLSIISVFTSVNTIALEGTKQFYGTSPQSSLLSLDSTRYARFFVVFPLLLGQFIVDRIATFDTIQWNFWPVRLVSSIIFALWFLGWISSLRNSFLCMINILNHIILGDERKSEFYYGIGSLFLNLIPWALYCILVVDKLYGHLMLIGGATITSILTFIFSMLIFPGYSVTKSGWYKIILKIIIEITFCVSLLVITALANLTNIGVVILSIINCSLFLIILLIEDLFRGRSHFGCRIKVLRNICGGSNKFLLLKRVILRITMSLTMIGITQQLYRLPCHYMKFVGYQLCPNWISHTLGWNQTSVMYVLMPLLVYRCFKRAISEPLNWSFHISIFISLIVRVTGSPLDDYSYGIFIVLLWPPFPNNFYIALISPFIIPKKLQRPNENLCVKILYLLVTLIGLILYCASFGVLQLTMLFGLPIFWCVIPSTTQGNQIITSEQSLYMKMLQNLNCQLFEGRKQGIYLLRLEKYIMTVHIKSQGYGFGEIVEFKGMQAQEVTSCHSRQGQTIDLQVQETWIQNQQDNQNLCRLFSPYTTVLWPQSQHFAHIPIQNDMKLTGIIQTKEFLSLFKNTVLNALLYEFSKLQMSSQQKQQAQIMYSEINTILKKQQNEGKYSFDFDFAKKLNFLVSLPNPSNNQITKKKVPLNLVKKGRNQVANQFGDLIQQPKHQEKDREQIVSSMSHINPLVQTKIDEINFSTVFTFYYYTVGKQQYLNLNKVYQIIAEDSSATAQIVFKSKEGIASRALGSAFKISVSKFLDNNLTVSPKDFQQYDKDQFLGTIESNGFSEAVRANKQDIWTISYLKKQISIKRLSKSQARVYIFSVDQVIARSVWNNLRFELLFAANNDDERYSIQTHGKLLRNLWVQSCQQPFGYAGYYSGDKINV